MIEHILDFAGGLLGQYTLWLLLPSVGIPLAWYFCLPRIMPGIPYDAKSAGRPWGDALKLLKAARHGSDILHVFADMCIDLGSPIVQFLNVPWTEARMVVVSDFREIEDILTRRTKEFDRLDGTKDALNPLLREATLNMVSNDRFKAQRKLWAGVMTPEFVNKIASLHVHTSCLNLVKLWKRKAELAQEQPFDAVDDLRYEGFDAIWGFTFGTELGSTEAQWQHQLQIDPASLQLSENKEKAIDLPKGEPPALYQTIRKLLDRLEEIVGSPLPTIHTWLIVKSPSFRRALREKEERVSELVASSRANFAGSSYADEELATSAMDQVLRRLHNSKIESLTSDSKDPDQHLKDELFLFIIAGYETTSTAMSWIVKFLAAHQEDQTKLREELRSAFPDSKTPSASTILSANLPYLEAFMAEVLRCSRIAGATARVAKSDTSILGKPIPKGTILFMCINAQTYLYKTDLHVPEEDRSETSKTYGGARGQRYVWPLEGRQEFRPERWLHMQSVTEKDSTITKQAVYDENAGPSMPFGLGPRGCFGKRLALAKLRINITLLVLAFEFLEVRGKGKAKKGKEFDLADLQAEENVARRPQHSYVRLKAL